MMRLVVLTVAALSVLPAAAFAQDEASVPPAQIVITQQTPIATPSRPAILPGLYISLAALQGYDGYTTLRAVKDGGGREANVVLGGVADKPVAMWAVKAASTGLTVLLAEQLWRTHHRGEAIVTMLAANGLMTFVAVHNASVVSASR